MTQPPSSQGEHNPPFSKPNLDVPQILGWAYQAGQIARSYFNRIDPWNKSDGSFLTSADLEIEHFLAARFQAAYPDHDVIGEEGLRIQGTSPSPNTWAIDPLDGTTSFVKGLPGWGISIGLLHQGLPYFGLFYMPLLDDVTYTPDPQKVTSNRPDLHLGVRPDWSDKGFMAVSASSHAQFDINVCRTRTLGGSATSLVYTARGSATAAFLPRARLWDLVAGAAILAQAGGQLRYLSGRRVDFLELLDGQLAPEPILAASPGLLPDLQRRIRPRSGGEL